jgi:glycerol kinase
VLVWPVCAREFAAEGRRPSALTAADKPGFLFFFSFLLLQYPRPSAPEARGLPRSRTRSLTRMKHVLAIDEGTTGATCLMIDEQGRVTGRGYREIPQYFPKPGWVEHDALEILECVIGAAKDAVRAAGTTPDAIGITNQRETVVVWERASGKPVHRAIVWQDRRTADRCAELAPRATWINERTGLVTDPYFSATKIEWLLREKRLLDRFKPGDLAVGTMDTWLVWNLTGGTVHATDPTNASRTMLYDINSQTWSDELCALFGVPREMLPEVRRSSGDFGIAHGHLLGFDAPILGIAGDQQAALFGQGCWAPGSGKNTYGTGAFLLMNAGTERPAARDGLLTTIACDATGGPVYALEAAIFIAGAAVQWLRDGLGIIAQAAETEQLARSIESTDGVYFVPALTGLGAPHWEPNARGTIVGLTRGTGRAHLARAALEAMAYGTADVLGSMRNACGDGAAFDWLRVDGGATNNDWLMQFQADVLGVLVERPDMVETTALGAAGLAGLAAGIWKDADEFLATRRFTSFEPMMSRADVERGMHGWRRAVRAAVSWARDAEQ